MDENLEEVAFTNSKIILVVFFKVRPKQESLFISIKFK